VLPPKLVVLEPFLAIFRGTRARELRIGEIVRRVYQPVEKPVGARFDPRPATRHTALGAFQARFLGATSNADYFNRLVVSPKWKLVFVIEPSAIADE